MKIQNLDFRLVATAAAAIVCAGSAHAALFGERFNPAKLTIVEDASGATSATYNGAPVGKLLYLSGASASSKTLGAFVINDNCDPATLSVLWNSASGSDYRAYACDMKAGNIINAGAADSLVVIKRDKGGSTTGVGPIATPAKIDFMSLAGCVATGAATPDLNTPNYTCGNIEQRYPDAGFSDVEPSILAALVNGGSGSLAISGSLTIKPVFTQLIGVGVNTKLYRALQATQGLTPNDAPENRPTLDKTFVANAVAGKLNGGGSGKGWGLVVSKTVDPDVDQKQINICRRVNGSGTQAAANIYFLQNPCSPGQGVPAGNAVPLAVKGTGTSANNTSYTSTGLVESCLGSVNGLTDATLTNKDGYAIGHVGRDNDPFAGGDKGYRFVKVDGHQPEAHPDPATGLCTYAGCNDAQSGKYDYVFESTMQWNSGSPGNAGKSAALNNIATLGFNASALKGNTAAVIAGVMAPPSTYSGLYGALPLGSDAQVYGARVSRLGNSCAPLTVSK